MNWQHGYYAQSGYTYGYYAETMPKRLQLAALLQGHILPDRGFRYLDAGCGQGYNLILAAAAHPDSEFVGIDFMPEHIAHAQQLAQAAGLTNVRFIEGDFIELAKQPQAYPELAQPFDYAVCHGIATWVAEVVKQALFSLIGQVLKPAGVFYNSYNTFPGWLASTPLQHLVLLEQHHATGEAALISAQQKLNAIKEFAPTLFQQQPGLLERLTLIQGQNPAYLVQEYNNQHWQPMYFSDMCQDMAQHKLSYIGSATLTDMFDDLLGKETAAFLKEQPNVQLKEQLRDYVTNQGFRRDLYIKGQYQHWPLAIKAQREALSITLNPITPRVADSATYQIVGSAIKLDLKADVCNELLDYITAAPQGVMLKEILATQPKPMQGVTLQRIALLLHGGWIVAVSDACEPHSAQRLNAVLAKSVSQGAPYTHLMLPKSGTALQVGEVEWLLIHCHNEGYPVETWHTHMNNMLQQLGKSLSEGGQALTGEALVQKLSSTVEDFITQRLPFYQRMQAVN